MTPGLIELRDFARRYTAAWCSRNPAMVAAFFSYGGSLTVNEGVPAVGRDAITHVALSFMSAFPDLQMTMEDLQLGGGAIEYHWILTGTNAGPEGTGHRVRIRGSEKWRLGEDGLISSSQGNFDATEYRRQLERGMSPDNNNTTREMTIIADIFDNSRIVDNFLSSSFQTESPDFLFRFQAPKPRVLFSSSVTPSTTFGARSTCRPVSL